MIRRPPRSTLSLHDALPISFAKPWRGCLQPIPSRKGDFHDFSSAAHDRGPAGPEPCREHPRLLDRKSTRLNSSHSQISYAVFCLKKKKTIASMYTASIVLGA